MLTEAQQQHLIPVTRTMQIIIVALAGGVLMFAGVVLMVSLIPGGQGQPPQPFLTYIAVGAAFLILILATILPGMIAEQQTRAIALHPPAPNVDAKELGDVPSLANAYQARLIVRAALLEGAAFFNLVAYMIEQNPLCLAAAVILLLFILAQFPTRSRVEEWIEDRLKAIEMIRPMGSSNAR